MTNTTARRTTLFSAIVLIASAWSAAAQTASFVAGKDFLVGSTGPTSAAVADFNGDGIADVAVARPGYINDDSVPGSAAILLGLGSGSLGPPQDVSAGLHPYSVAAADFNGDGVFDIAVANYGSGTVSVLLGNGDGTFQATLTFASGAQPTFAAVGDFNRDAIADLIVVSSSGVGSLLGNGDGSFQNVRFFSAGTSPLMAAVGDFNADNVADLAVANEASSNVSVLLGLGDGSFLPAQNLSTTPHPRFVAVSDFNGDGIRDLAINCGGDPGHTPEISIFLGAGGGTFQPGQHIRNVVISALAVGDVNADGNADLVEPPGVLLGNGDGTFQPVRNSANIELYGGFVVAGELNGDGTLDFVMQHGINISVLLGNGDGTFLEAPMYAAGSYPTSAALGDFNGDGVLDIAAADANSFVNATVAVLLGNADGTFGAPSAFSVGSNPVAVAAADLNGDGIPDLAVVDAGSGSFGDISVLIGNGDGTFQASQPYSTGRSPAGIVVTDLNLDGVLDLAVADGDSSTISVLLGNGDGTFQATRTGPAGENPLALAAGDFDGDAIPDLAVANEHNVYVTRGFANGEFTVVQVLAQDTNPRALSVDDFNRDGKLDLLILTIQPTQSVSLLLGNGDGTFQESAQTFAVGSFPWAMAVGDFNGDGRLDAAVANAGSHDVSVLVGHGDGTFEPALTFRSGEEPRSAAVGDFNRDGKPDLVVANQRSNSVSILINDTGAVPILQSYSLTVNKQGNGGGTVTSSSSPAGSNEIDCGATCTADYAAGTGVTLTAQADAGSALIEWAGCDSVSGTTCIVTMDAAKSVTATFAVQQFMLSVTKSGVGNGTVTSTSNPPSASQINCGAVCYAAYGWSTVVTLSATPTLGNLFLGWKGCDAASGTRCLVTMQSAKSVKATFVGVPVWPR